MRKIISKEFEFVFAWEALSNRLMLQPASQPTLTTCNEAPNLQSRSFHTDLITHKYSRTLHISQRKAQQSRNLSSSIRRRYLD